ncbi:transglutaminase domain-containing protein [Eubacterium xylanophilum]|uniref:transglutaminase domain-containing protein n=1 Tax=Eubacterium xylanophilum TaxID=39497 RepID=UPI00047D701D|nr:transglutaminase-like domain-containing protein [Eubacterium xylanophilum]
MHLSKKVMRTALTLSLSFVVLANSTLASAADFSVSNLSDLASLVREEGLKRNTGYEVEYTGPESDLDRIFDDDLTFFFHDMLLLDDPSTSDDADYLVGNINFNAEKPVSVEGNILYFDYPFFEASEETQFVNDNVKQILNDIGVDGLSNYEKVKAIHDYVCNLITYVDDAENYSSMYKALTEGKGLCNSYAVCMYKLLVEAGIPCKWVGGKAGTGRDSGGHAWNIVALGDKWYNLDATWDDQEEGINYDYFLKGSEDFDEADSSQIHTPDKPYLSDDFQQKFPMAKTSFVSGSNDNNSSTTIGDKPVPTSKPVATPVPTGTKQTGTGATKTTQSVTPVKYKLSDFVNGKYPSSGKFTVKRKKKKDVQLFIKNSTMAKLIKKVTYKVTTGKKRIKSVKNYGLLSDDDGYFTNLRFKGKKKGTVKIKITLTIANGQKLSFTFKGKVK